MKLGVLTCMWKRPEVFEIFATGLNRLKDNFNVITLSVGSEGKESMALCAKYGINYISFYNKPLGSKFNTGMRAMQQFNPDYVMILGSDDLISNAAMKRVLELCAKGHDVVGFTDVWFYDLIQKNLHYWPGYGHRGDKADASRAGEAIGLGRTLSRAILNKMNWQPWKPDVNVGLDWWMTQKLKGLKVIPKTINLKNEGLFAVDLKGKLNICNQVMYTTQKDETDLSKHLSAKEIKMIHDYR